LRDLSSTEISSLYQDTLVFPFETTSLVDSFAIKINGRDLSTIPNINGRPIDNYYKRNGRLLRK